MIPNTNAWLAREAHQIRDVRKSRRGLPVLVKITNHCTMNCSHCMDDAGPNGKHMLLSTYMATLDWLAQLDPHRLIMLSGGEPTDHPDWLVFVEEAKLADFRVVVLSNGLFTLDPDAKPFLTIPDIMWQFTNDHRYYPTRIDDIPGHTIERKIQSVSPQGRARKNHLPSTRMAPHCFNLRSVNRRFRHFFFALGYLRAKRFYCTPHIDVDGNIRAGESASCHIIGTVHSTAEELTDALLTMKCNKCGLEDGLTSEHLSAIHGE